jgi:hypothetical protein
VNARKKLTLDLSPILKAGLLPEDKVKAMEGLGQRHGKWP